MITNENEFLSMLVKNMDNEHKIHHSKAMELSGLNDEFYLEICKSLKSKGYIYTDAEFITLTLSGIQNCKSSSKSTKKFLSWLTVFTAKKLFEIIGGIAVAVIAAFIIYHFGWQ